ncbi:hypothetical protein [Lachnoclostridium phytofermentans]|nr:hypothetical protein [Lachnoclostridium phytofermentans]
MNCHDNNNNSNNGKKNEKGHKRHLSHIFMMLICCGAPIILLMLIPLLKRVGIGAGANGILSLLASLACPLMMMVMIPMMMKGLKNKEDNHNSISSASTEQMEIGQMKE